MARFLEKFLALLVILISGAIVWGWTYAPDALKPLLPYSILMAYNGALLFLLAGGVLFLPKSRQLKGHWWKTGVGGFIIAVGALTLSQDFTGWDLGIDTLLNHAILDPRNPHPGRMASTTSFGMMLCGWLLLLLAQPEQRSRKLQFQLIMFSILVLSVFGSIAAGFRTSLASSFYQAGRMSFGTAFAFILLSGAFWFSLKRDLLQLDLTVPQSTTRERMFLYPMAMLILVAGASCYLYDAMRLREDVAIKNAVQVEGSRISQLINLQAKDKMPAIKRMALRWEANGGTPQAQWTADANNYVDQLPGMRAIEYVDANYHVQWVAPESAGEGLIGSDVLAEHSTGVALANIEDKTGITIVYPPDTPGSYKKFIAYAPIHINGQFGGFMAGVFSAGDFFTQALAGTSADFAIWMFEEDADHDTEYFRTKNVDSIPPDFAAKWGSEQQIHIYDRAFRAKVVPTPGFVLAQQTSIPLIVLVSGIVIALLLALTMLYMMISQAKSRSLEESEERNELALRGLSVGLWDWNILTGDMYWSPKFLELLGIRREDFYPMISSFYPLLHPDDKERVTQVLSDHLQHKGPYNVEYRLRHTSGKYVWIQATGQAKWLDGKAVRMVGSSVDITEKVNAKMLLQASEALKQAILDSSSYMIITIDTRGTVLTFNHAAELALGYTADEVIGKCTPALWHMEDEIVARADQMSYAFRREIPPGFEVLTLIPETDGSEERDWTFVTKSGEQFPVRLSVTVMYDDNNKIVGYLGISRDITKEKKSTEERRLAEERLRHSEEVFRSAMENASIGMALINLTGKWLKVNTALCSLLGYDRETLLKMDYQMITHPEDLPLDIDNMRKIFSGEIHNYSIEKRYLHRNGHVIWAQLSVSLVRNEDNMPSYFIAQVQDITGRKEIDRMKGEFISVVSHELRTPLTSIRGSLGLIAGAMSKDLPEKVRHLVDIAYKNSERLILLINDILDIDKIAAGQMRFDMKRESLSGLIAQAVEANQAYADRFGVKMEVMPISPAITIDVDSARFAQVLSNLMSNAAKFSPKDGTVKLFTQSTGQKVRICVQDNGPGIAEEFRDRIFGKFTQADSSATREKGGTGLGLHITREIVRHMNGEIGFDTKVGAGTTFWVEFIDTSLPKLLKPEELPKGSGNYRVLICEDDPDIVEILKLQMQHGGFAADVAYSIADARAKIKTNAYQAMTLDLSFPGEDGLDFIRELRGNAETTALPIVVVSAKADEGKRSLSGDAFGVIDWLKKPLDEKQLLDALLRAISSREIFPQVLHVEDDTDISAMLGAALHSQAKLVNVSTLQEAREKLAREHFSLIILDLGLPDGNGLSLLPDIAELSGKPVPVLVLSANESLPAIRENVTATMIKSRMSETKIVETILSLIASNKDSPVDKPATPV